MYNAEIKKRKAMLKVQAMENRVKRLTEQEEYTEKVMRQTEQKEKYRRQVQQKAEEDKLRIEKWKAHQAAKQEAMRIKFLEERKERRNNLIRSHSKWINHNKSLSMDERSSRALLEADMRKTYTQNLKAN